MAIVASDIKFKLSTTEGSAGSSQAQADPNASLGKFVSTTEMTSGANSLFDDISGAENAAETIDYRCVFVHNTHESLTLQNAVVYVSSEVAGGANIAIAVDDIGPVDDDSVSDQADEIANETTAPTSVGEFSTPTTADAGLDLGDIGPGQVRAVWVRRTATNSAAINDDGFTLAVTGDTAA